LVENTECTVKGCVSCNNSTPNECLSCEYGYLAPPTFDLAGSLTKCVCNPTVFPRCLACDTNTTCKTCETGWACEASSVNCTNCNVCDVGYIKNSSSLCVCNPNY